MTVLVGVAALANLPVLIDLFRHPQGVGRYLAAGLLLFLAGPLLETDPALIALAAAYLVGTAVHAAWLVRIRRTPR